MLIYMFQCYVSSLSHSSFPCYVHKSKFYLILTNLHLNSDMRIPYWTIPCWIRRSQTCDTFPCRQLSCFHEPCHLEDTYLIIARQLPCFPFGVQFLPTDTKTFSVYFFKSSTKYNWKQFTLKIPIANICEGSTYKRNKYNSGEDSVGYIHAITSHIHVHALHSPFNTHKHFYVCQVDLTFDSLPMLNLSKFVTDEFFFYSYTCCG